MQEIYNQMHFNISLTYGIVDCCMTMIANVSRL